MRFSVEGISTAVLESAAKSRVVPLERKEAMALKNLKRLVQQDRSAGIPFLAPTENVNSDESLNKPVGDVTLGAGEQMYQPGSFSIELPGDGNPSGTEEGEVVTESLVGVSDFQSVPEQIQEVSSVNEETEEGSEEVSIADLQSALNQLQEVPSVEGIEEGTGDPDWSSFADTEEEGVSEGVRTDDIPKVDWGSIPVEAPEEEVEVPKEPESKELSFDTIINRAKRKRTARKVRASSLEEFLRENGSCTVKEAMKYFSAKEIQMKVNTG